ncbi:hypothetical protein P154DRAFT_518934 [Amniculicola lignicola CBS 123094]|uniref:AHC1-like C2H2 zinc-finger domain-containing protein n=1 Tax=Amniculicola lignicola CBS 123094 TaxID=1392246 RepID=A0A6A5WUU3_9PLEO|nr:hypothetical protein P154DRAFT_518934 [Amniculicola lignicola CBS 123094]
MQSMFRLPWSTETPGDKIMEKATLHKTRPLPVVEMPAFVNKLKRKATDSPEPTAPQLAHAVKKWKNARGEVKPAVVESDRHHVIDGVVTESKPVEASGDVPKAASADVLESRPKAQPVRREGATKPNPVQTQKLAAQPESCSIINSTPAMETGLTSLQQSVEAHFNYEILLKHNELRLIEQELAKCQVALEQLRRCSLVPFPGVEGLSQNVSGGVGPALQPPPGYTTPQHAAPWGVTDGPYTRHYAKWLIQDPKFDSMPERALAAQSHGYFGYGEGRTTRGSFAEYGFSGKPRTSRTSTGTLKLPALGENPAPAPRIDPLLHKRSTDGQWVRLFCAQCGHSNFSNTQGFLNHCRIKHNQVFKSHDQAAIACGVPVDTNEVGNPVSMTEPPSSTATTPAVSFPLPATPGFVHSLVRGNPAELAKGVHRDLTIPARDDTSLVTSSITKAPTTPYMNSLLQKHGFSGDYKTMVATARTKVDLDAIETSDEDMVDSIAPTPITIEPAQLARLPVSVPHVSIASKSPSARPGSRKGQPNGHARFPLTLPRPVALNGGSHGNGHRMPDSPVDLSPNTVESNPGLVSDHDDEDDEDGYDARSQPDIVMNDDVVVEDGSDVEGSEERVRSRKGLDGCFEKAEGSRKH